MWEKWDAAVDAVLRPLAWILQRLMWGALAITWGVFALLVVIAVL